MSNSGNSYKQLKDEGVVASRKQLIIEVLETADSMTDREIQNRLCDMGYLHNSNYNRVDKVQPRISELIREDVVTVDSNVYDEITNRTVRSVKLIEQSKDNKQMRFFV